MISNEIISKIESSSLEDALALVANLFPGQTYFSTSLGQEDQVLTHAIYKAQCDVKMFTLDTGRLFYETYDLLAKTNFRYGGSIKICFPDADDVEQYVNQKGINAFYESVENRKECCHIRKVKPLNIALKNAKVWITGLRAGQSANRHTMKMFEWDDERNLYKFNPLIHWSLDEVIQYLKDFDVPYNPLHDKGFVSIGCACCTKAIEPGEDPRAGRWWWEDANKKECGLHVHENKISQNIKV
jgi:phosphoadenosine phosphosulfate reductase